MAHLEQTPHLAIWLAHSCYSFLQAPSQPRSLLEAAQKNGWGGLCQADFDGVYGLARFFLTSRNPSQGTAFPRLFYGAQLRLPLGSWDTLSCPALCRPDDLLAPGFLQPRIAMVALSHQGYTGLCRLLRYSHRQGKNALMLDLLDDQTPWPQQDVALILPMRGWSALCPPHTKRFAGWLGDLESLASFWKKQTQRDDLFYLAATPPSQPLEHQSLLAHLAAHDALKIPLLATEDVFFATPEDKPTADLLAAIRLNAPLREVKPWACLPNAMRSVASPRRLLSFCSGDPRLRAALNNNTLLMGSCNFSFDELRYEYPKEFVPEGMTPIAFLRSLTRQCAQALYPNGTPARMVALLEKELTLVDELGFADYFLTVWDIVRYARQQNILCQGRGSAANSAICFVLGITAVDPMVSDVLFERFVSRERGEPPDIDVDFEHERREEVIQYIYERYGRTRAAMVANVITFRRQGALRAAGKALGIDLNTLDRILVCTKDRFQRDVPLATRVAEQCTRLGVSLSSVHQDHWLQAAKNLVGLPRHLGIHSGGFVISQHNLDSICPIEPATMADRSVIQWSKDDLEGLGLFKIDVLALGMLTALRKTLALLAEHGVGLPSAPHEPITLASLPAGCTTTYDMICQARTMGTFQIESRAQMAIIPRLQPRSFYDLVIQIGIIRPGPIVAGMVTRYVARKTGKKRVHYPDPRLKPILERTLGVPVFQEQVMRIAMTVGDFSPGEADELRRSMGAWKISGTIQRFEEKLRTGMKRNGISEVFADEIYRQIAGFAEYGFPESHAISFAHLAYASAWLKAHFPTYFLAGVLNAQPLGFYSVHSLLQEAQQAGVRVLKPCLLFSEWDHAVSPSAATTAGEKTRSPMGTLRLGLRLVQGLQQAQVAAFVQTRRIWMATYAPHHRHLRLWSSHDLRTKLDSFLALMSQHFDSRSCLQLVLGGLLDGLSIDRRMVLWHWLGRPGHLMEDLDLRSFREPQTPASREFEDYGDIRDDFGVLGTSVRGHPMVFIKRWMWPFEIFVKHVVTAQHLIDQRDHLAQLKQTVCVCGLITMQQAPPTAKGMVFVTLEDETGTLPLTLTPQIVARYRQELALARHGLLCVAGVVQGADFGYSIKVKKVFQPNASVQGLPEAGASSSPPNDPNDLPHSLKNPLNAEDATTHDPQPPMVRKAAPGHTVVHHRKHHPLFSHSSLWQEEQP
jgi:error-prone DNA polymerase